MVLAFSYGNLGLYLKVCCASQKAVYFSHSNSPSVGTNPLITLNIAIWGIKSFRKGLNESVVNFGKHFKVAQF